MHPQHVDAPTKLEGENKKKTQRVIQKNFFFYNYYPRMPFRRPVIKPSPKSCLAPTSPTPMYALCYLWLSHLRFSPLYCLHHTPTQYTFGVWQFKRTSSSTLFGLIHVRLGEDYPELQLRVTNKASSSTVMAFKIFRKVFIYYINHFQV